MSEDRAGIRDTGRADYESRGFAIAVWSSIASLVLFSPLVLVGVGWFLEEYQEADGASAVSHRVHEISFGLLFAIAAVGVWSQLRDPERNVAGVQQMVVALGTLVLMVPATTGTFEWLALVFLVPVAALVATHPARSSLVSVRLPRGPGLVIMLVGLLVLLDATVREVTRATAGAQDHTSHWAAMAAFFLTLILLGFIAAMRPPGHRTTAATIGVSSVMYGVASAAFPFDASHAASAPVWVAWGVAWMVLATRAEASAVEPDVVRKGAFRRLARRPGVGFAVLIGALAWAVVDGGAPRVPHNLDNVPGEGSVGFAAVTRATCLKCHNAGVGGAPVVDHRSRRCDSSDGGCFFARSDCLGCHELNPQLMEVTAMTAGWIDPHPPVALPAAVVGHRLDEGRITSLVVLTGRGPP